MLIAGKNIKSSFGFNQKIEFIQIIHNTKPHTKSYAAYLLLKENLQIKDIHHIEHNKNIEKFKTEKFNSTILKKIFFKKIKQKYGNLKCELCGKENLVARGMGGDTKDAKEHKNIATIDHKLPISEGGLKYSFSNWLCLCWHCNFKKDNRRIIKTNKGFLIL